MQEQNNNQPTSLTQEIEQKQHNQQQFQEADIKVTNYPRRNALTPDNQEHIEPIRQTEMQEKMSCLNVTDTPGASTSNAQ